MAVYTAFDFSSAHATELSQSACRERPGMLRVGLTGGVACGKSTVGKLLAQRGAHFLQADTLAHQLYEPGAPAYAGVVRAFGREILHGDGTVNRAALANRAFPDRIAELNAIVHPAVIEAQNRWMREAEQGDPNGIAVVEAALLIEAGAHKDFDKVMVVTCPFEQKVARYAARAGVSLEVARGEVVRRAAAQFSDEEKAWVGDFVIDNSGALEETERQVVEVWGKLKRAGIRD
jgi:dephospho-CoA kinase